MNEFRIPENALPDFDVWRADHEPECTLPVDPLGDKYAGAIGGRWTYSFTPTGLGTVIKIRCGCGAECDLTNYDDW
jgi:hypothetical protein